MRKVLGTLYIAVFMFGAYTLSIQAKSSPTDHPEAVSACGSCRYKLPAHKVKTKRPTLRKGQVK